MKTSIIEARKNPERAYYRMNEIHTDEGAISAAVRRFWWLAGLDEHGPVHLLKAAECDVREDTEVFLALHDKASNFVEWFAGEQLDIYELTAAMGSDSWGETVLERAGQMQGSYIVRPVCLYAPAPAKDQVVATDSAWDLYLAGTIGAETVNWAWLNGADLYDAEFPNFLTVELALCDVTEHKVLRRVLRKEPADFLKWWHDEQAFDKYDIYPQVGKEMYAAVRLRAARAVVNDSLARYDYPPLNVQ